MSRRVMDHIVIALSGVLAFATVPAAAQTEAVPVRSAATLLGDKVRGPNYQVEDAVRSDGFLQVFSLTTPYGHYRVEGRDMLRVRINELAAVNTLEHMKRTQVFAQSAAKAAMRPVGLAVGLISDPAGTVDHTMTGVGNLFSRMASNVGNLGHNPDRPAESALGVSTAKRQIAYQLGVDPYTDFRPLADALTETARVAALGNLAVSAAFRGIPGSAGTAVSASGSVQGIAQSVRDKTPSELRDQNRARLTAMGVSGNVANALLDNTSYTPADQTALVAALGRMNGVANRHLFVARAAQAPNRDLAYFMRRRAELIATQHTTEPLLDFIEVRGFALNRARASKVVAVLPVDELAWTKEAEAVVDAVGKEVKDRKLGDVVELRVTGTVTPLTAKNLRERGWKLYERALQ